MSSSRNRILNATVFSKPTVVGGTECNSVQEADVQPQSVRHDVGPVPFLHDKLFFFWTMKASADVEAVEPC